MSPRKKSKSPAAGDLIILHWEDIREDSAWQDTDTPEGELHLCESVGWVASWGKKIVLTRTFGRSDDKRVAGDTLTLPKGCVTHWEVLKAKNPVAA